MEQKYEPDLIISPAEQEKRSKNARMQLSLREKQKQDYKMHTRRLLSLSLLMSTLSFFALLYLIVR